MAFREKRTKIKILQNKADHYNQEFDSLEDQGYEIHEIQSILREKEEEKYKPPKETLPFEDDKKLVFSTNPIEWGSGATHKTKSAAKDMNTRTEKNFQKYKDFKRTGKLEKSHQMEFDAALEEKKHVDKMQKAIYEDHINQLFDNRIHKIPEKSHYGEEFGFTKYMQEECDTQNFDHHLRKNDLKWYCEAYAKYKDTMR